MTLIRQLAFRYFRGKRSANAVPVLSRISIAAIAVCSAAMVIVFSALNGLEDLAKDQYKAFYPDIKITLARGKFFPSSAVNMNVLKHIEGVKNITAIIEDNVLANNENELGENEHQQKVLTLKGINNDYFDVNNIKENIRGADTVIDNESPTAIIGKHIYYVLGLDTNNVFNKVAIYYPNPVLKNPEADPTNAFQELRMHPTGVFHIQDEYDDKYILAPLSQAQQLFRQPGMYSSIELKTKEGSDINVKERIQKLLGHKYTVATRYEQNKTFYLVVKAEKWAVYFILVMVTIIASFNMVGTLGMLVLEKRKDIAILQAMGAEEGTIKKVFLLEGMLWSLTGGISGIVIGSIICLAQQKFSFIKMQGDFIVDAYPVKMEIYDIVLVLITILCVGLLASWYPAYKSTATTDPSLKST